MTKQRLQEYRRQLIELGERLNGDLPGLREAALRRTGGEASGGLSNAPLHPADLATDNFQQTVDTGVLQNKEQVLGAIGEALDRLDAGTFGRCERCGQEVPKQRLRTIPYASRCSACEEKAEQEDGFGLGQGAG